MTELLSDIETPSDAELISRVRGGDVAAYGELFSRHVDAAKRLARQLVRGPDADDLVSDAFAKVLHVLQGGGGPDVAFRAYLLTSVRRLHVDRVRAQAKLHTTDDLTPFDPGIPFQDTAVAGFESGAAARAFASLPERWQLVLWHLEVEGQKPADIAPLLGMSANSVSALAYRAREGLRQAFLTMHLSDISDAECRWVNEHLGAYVRKGLSKRDNAKVAAHLDECRRCTATYLELTEVNSNLAGIIAPLLLGAAATGYVASAGGSGVAGVVSLLSRAKDVVLANSGAATAAGVAAGVAAMATAGIVLAHVRAPDTVSGAAEPPGITTSATQTPGSPGTRPSTGTGNTHVGSPPLPIPNTTAGPAFLLGPGAPTSTTGPGAPGTDQPAPGLTDFPSGVPTSVPTQAEPSGPSSPSDGPTATDTPTDNPPPALVETDVHVGAASIVGGDVEVTLTGSPDLPSRVLVALSANHDGITFQGNADCAVQQADQRLVSCSTPAAAGSRSSRSAARTTGDASYTLRIPLDIPPGQPDTHLQLMVSVPDGYDDPVTSDNTAELDYLAPAPPAFPVDLAMGPLQVLGQDAGSDGTDVFHLRTHVAGVPSGAPVTFRLDGVATFGDPFTSGCARDDDTHVTCTLLGSESDLDFKVLLTSDQAQTVSIGASAPAGYADSDPANNTTPSTVLEPTPEIDLAMGDLVQEHHSADAAGTDQFALSGTLHGLPASVDHTTFTLTGGNASFADSPDCQVDQDASRVTCTRPGADDRVRFAVNLSDASAEPVTIRVDIPDGYVDTNPSNDSASMTLSATPRTDVAVNAPASVPVDADGQATVHTTLSGVNGLPSLTLMLGGDPAKFAGDPPGGCGAGSSLTDTTVICVNPSEHVDLVVQPDNPAASSSVMITAAVPDGWIDENPVNDTATTVLNAEPTPPADDNLILDSVTAKHGWDRVIPPFGHVTPLHAKVHGVSTAATSVRFTLSGASTGADQIRFDPALLPPDGGGRVDCTLSSATEVVCTAKPGDGRVLPAAFWVDMYVVRPYGLSPGQVTVTATPDGVADNRDDNWQEVTVY